MQNRDGAVVIQIMGENSELAKALKTSENQLQNFSNEMSEINKSLQLNPENVELLGQKFAVLGKEISATQERLNLLKDAEQEVTEKFANGDIGASEYDAFRREVLNTEAALRELMNAQDDILSSMNQTSDVVSLAAEEFNSFISDLKNFDNSAAALKSQMSEINNALKLNPGNTELLTQKYVLLGKQISDTRSKLELLKNSEQQVKAAIQSGDIGADEYAAYRREVLNAEAALQDLIAAQNSMKDADGNLHDITEEMDNLGDSIDDAGESTVTFGDLLKANILSEYVQQGINKLASAFGNFIKNGVELASDLTEVQNVVDTTFGDGAAEIYEWADAAAESFGMSSLSAQQYTGTLGAMLKSSGVANESIVEMSENLVGLAGDMASFYNLDVEAAFEKIRSGISGETEPLKQLGINMSVANLEAYALANGIETAYDKMSQSEQTLLRYNYLMSQTADAQGDFSKTSDSYANQQRILQLQIENLSAALGEKLLPHLNDVISTANEKLPEIEGTVENIGEILGTVTGFALEHHEAIITLIAAYGTFHGVLKTGNAISSYVSSLKTLTNATQEATTAQQGMNAAAAVNPYALIVAGVAALVVALVGLSGTMDDVSTKLKDTAEESKAAYDEQKEKVSGLENELKETRDRIEEIQSKGKLDIADEKELEELQEQNKELETQIALENELLRVKKEQSSEDTIKALYSDDVTDKGSIAHLQRLIDEYNTLQESVENGEVAIENVNWQLENTKTVILEAWQETYSLAEGLDTTTESGAKATEELNNLRDSIYDLLDIEKESENIDLGGHVNGAWRNQEYTDNYNAEKQALEDEKALREQALEDYVADLDTKLKLRKINEETYYSELKNYLDENQDTESEAWFDQLERYEDYQQDKIDAAKKAADEAQKNAEKAAEDAKKAEEQAAEEKQKAYEKSVEDYANSLKDRLELDDNYTEEMYYNDLQKLVESLDEGSELYEKYNDEVLKGRKKLSDDIAKEIEDSKSEIEKKYQKLFDDLDAKRENYKKKLLSIGGNIFSVETVTDENGNKNTTYTINNIDEQIQKMREYNAAVKKLKEQGASESLLSELTSMSSDESANFAKYLSQMSDAEFAKINELYNEKQKVADELAQDLYADDAQAITDSMNAELEALTGSSAEYGKEAAASFANAFISEISGLSAKIAELFQNSDFSTEIKATVEAEQERYSPSAAYKAPENSTENNTSSADLNKFLNELKTIVSDINKPVQIYLDGQKIAETVSKYQGNYSYQTGG